MTPQVKNLVLKWFLPRLFLLHRLGRHPGGRVLVTSAQGGWPDPSSFLLQGQAGPQEHCGVGGSTLPPPHYQVGGAPCTVRPPSGQKDSEMRPPHFLLPTWC